MSEVSVNNDQTTPPAPSLNIQDIVFLCNVIDVASRRGTFRADEMSSIGAIYDKVTAFLKSTGALEETEAPATEDAQRSE